ncbi:DNA-binding protein [Gellertiella hungarica]|uniref:Putative DNA-binding protein n=1 Tax=Gellertiella hungarica TaxID=1572859 RepID=A0A7W6J3V6_9HYPH|nr:DNA-binding protein [Gellertiella hungarica]MBB4064290.1 putative DNA-binding protein [Gellertiella hungarica]
MSQPVDIPEDLFKRAEAAAAGKGEPVRHFILDAILEAAEDTEDLKAAEEALERIRNGEDEFKDAKKFWSGLALDDTVPEVYTKIRRKA